MHYKIETKRFDATPPEWLDVGEQCGALAREWSGRGDIIAYVGEGAGMGIAAALWNPVLAEMELSVEQAFGEGAKPQFIGDLTDRMNQFEEPVACGAILHEAGHAAHSKYDFSQVRGYEDKAIAMLVEMFEETRIEARMVTKWPRNRAFLRACALKLVVADVEESAKDAEHSHVLQLSRLMLLTLARVTCGSLDADDVKPIFDVAVKVLGEDLLGKLALLWHKAQQHEDDEDWYPLKALAEEWIRLLEETGHKTKPTKEEIEAAQAAFDAMAKAVGEIMESMGEMVGETEIRARSEAGEQAETEEIERQVAEASARDRESSAADKEAGRVFGKGTTDLQGIGTKSRVIEERPPTDKERGAALLIARMLEKAKYRDRVQVHRTSALPPGRLRSRGMVQAAAEEARGAIRTAEPWSSTRRYHTEDPNLKIGLMTDISGSMRSAMEPMAVTNWVFSEAGRRIQALMASVYFGNAVFPGLEPGQHMDKVKIYSAPDGTERFDQAFKALNGKLNLLSSGGARLLVVVSDLHHTPAERVAERKWFTRCAQEGVAVIIMPFEARGYLVSETTSGLPVRVLKDVDDPITAAMEIGKAAADALEAAGNRG